MDTLFTFLFKYAWFVFGLFALVQSVYFQTRVGKIAATTGDDPYQVRLFLLGYAIYYVMPYFVLGALQFLGGFESAFYVFFGSLTDPYVLAAIGFLILWWAAGLFFLFFRDGACKLIRYQLMRGIGAGSEKSVKLLFCAITIFMSIWIIVFRLLVPTPPF